LLATFYSLLFTCKTQVFEVEPRGFEPLASAVQRRRDALLDLSGVCKKTANHCIFSSRLFSQVVSVKFCKLVSR
jgi:endonuclease III